MGNRITLDYNAQSLRFLLEMICEKKNQFTHQDLVYWCDKFVIKYYKYEEHSYIEDLRDQKIKEEATAFQVAQNIGWQWYVHIAQHYTPLEVVQADLNTVQLPLELFQSWYEQMNLSRNWEEVFEARYEEKQKEQTTLSRIKTYGRRRKRDIYKEIEEGKVEGQFY